VSLGEVSSRYLLYSDFCGSVLVREHSRQECLAESVWRDSSHARLRGRKRRRSEEDTERRLHREETPAL